MVSVNRTKNIQPKMPVNARAIKARSCQNL
jgi:hypothetical protein